MSASGPKRLALVVVGMHRSGTSALTRVLSLLGADLPADLMGASRNNPAGYWEPLGLVQLHDELLNAVASHWHDIGPMPEFWKDPQFFAPYRQQIAKAVNRSFGESRLFVIKDPRISRMIPAIVEVLRSIDVEPRFLIALRHPLEVAHSLRVRDGFVSAKSLLLWLDHMLCAERDTRGFSRTVVFYDRLMKDWRGLIKDVSADLSISFRPLNEAAGVEIDSFLTPRLRHHSLQEDESSNWGDVVSWVQTAFEAIRSFNHADEDSIIRNLEEVHAQFSTAQKAFGPLLVQQQREAPEVAERYARDFERAGLELRLLSDRMSDRSRKIDSLHKLANSLERNLHLRKAESIKLAKQLEGSNAKHQRAQVQFRKLKRSMARKSAELKDRKAEISRLRLRVRKLEKLLAEVYRSNSWRATGPLRGLARFGRATARLIRGALRVFGHLVTGRGTLASRALVQGYRRWVPAPVRRLLPRNVRRRLKRRLNVEQEKPGATKRCVKTPSAAPMTNREEARAAGFGEIKRDLQEANWQAAANRMSRVMDNFDGVSFPEGWLVTVAQGLVEMKDYEGAIAVLKKGHNHLGARRRPLMAAEGIAYLRSNRFVEARDLWHQYWQLGEEDLQFREEKPRLVHARRGAGMFSRIMSNHAEFAYGPPDSRVCIYTALFGDYDELVRPLYQPPGIDFICFSDRPREGAGWTVRITDPDPGMGHPTLNNRKIKLLPHKFLPEYDSSLYIDANVAFLGDPILLICRWLRGKSFVSWGEHPLRSDIYEECETILANLRSKPSVIIDEYQYFVRQNVPRFTGLTENGFLWRDHHDRETIHLMEQWWDHVSRFGGRDQPALSHLMWKTGRRPLLMPESLGTVRDNDFYKLLSHKMSNVEAEIGKAVAHMPKAISAPANAPTLIGKGRSLTLVWVYQGSLKSSGSTVMRAFQLSEMARQELDGELPVVCVNEEELYRLSSAIVILTKYALKYVSAGQLESLKSLGNIICADYVDDEPRTDLDEWIDIYIASSITQFLNFKTCYPAKLVHMITHHADPRIEGLRGPTDYCNIGYFGELVNAKYRAELQGIIDFCQVNTKFSDEQWINRLRHSNVHYAVRDHARRTGLKPFLKGFIAAQCRANIIVPLLESDARYYVGSDYPYVLIDESLASITEMIEYVKETFGGAEWRRGLEVMASVSSRCSRKHVQMEVRELVELCI